MVGLGRSVIVFCILVYTVDPTGATADEHLAPPPDTLTEAYESGPTVKPGHIPDKLPLAMPRKAIPSITKESIDGQIEKGLRSFRKFTTEPKQYDSYSKLLGFSSVQQAATTTKGKPLPIYQIPLDALINYQPDSKPTNPVDLLTSSPPTVLVPLGDDQGIQSSLMIVGTGDQARIVARGPSKIFKNRKLDDLTNVDGIVKIAELHLHFFMRLEQSDIILAPITHYPFFKLEKDTEYSATALLANLKPKARKAAQAFGADSEKDKSEGSATPSQ